MNTLPKYRRSSVDFVQNSDSSREPKDYIQSVIFLPFYSTKYVAFLKWFRHTLCILQFQRNLAINSYGNSQMKSNDSSLRE